MFGIIVNKHVFRGRVHGQGVVEVHCDRGRDLESTHIPGVSCVLEAILVTFEEKFELISEKNEMNNISYVQCCSKPI